MGTFFKAAVCLLLLVQVLGAESQTKESCMAPDYKHEIFLKQEDPDSGGYELGIRNVSTDRQIFSREWGGYADFSGALWPDNFKCVWSPDSKFVALFQRGTKRSGDTTLYFVAENSVQEIAVPDVMPSIRPHLTKDIRAIWIRPEVWLPGHVLIVSIEGTQQGVEYGDFRFILTLQIHADKKGRYVAGIESFKQDKSIPFSAR